MSNIVRKISVTFAPVNYLFTYLGKTGNKLHFCHIEILNQK